MEFKQKKKEFPVRSMVITGPTGSIGTALIRLCIKQGIHVVAVVRPDSGRIMNIPQDPLVKIVRLGLEKIDKLPEITDPVFDVFVHLGWAGTFGDSRNDTATQYANIGYSLLAVQAAKTLGCHTFIGAGSQAEYGRVEGVLTADTPAFPENGYGIAKLCAGQLTRLLCSQMGIRHIWTRILSVYGPYDGEGTLISCLLRSFMMGETMETTAGEQIWDYLYSDDAAGALFALAQKGFDGQVYCIGSGQGRTLRSYMEEAATSAQNLDALEAAKLTEGSAGSGEVAARERLTDHIAAETTSEPTENRNLNYVNCITFGAKPYAPKQVMHLVADLSKLTEDTGFQPQVPFDEGIRRTYLWMKDRLT